MLWVQATASIYFELAEYDEAFSETSKACLLDRDWQPPWIFLEGMQGGPEKMIIDETMPAEAEDDSSTVDTESIVLQCSQLRGAPAKAIDTRSRTSL